MIVRRFHVYVPGHAAEEGTPVSMGAEELNTTNYRGNVRGHVAKIQGDHLTIATADADLIRVMETGGSRLFMRPGGVTLFVDSGAEPPGQAPRNKPTTPAPDWRARILRGAERSAGPSRKFYR